MHPQSVESVIATRERERHQEVLMRADAATFEQLATELALDQVDAQM